MGTVTERITNLTWRRAMQAGALSFFLASPVMAMDLYGPDVAADLADPSTDTPSYSDAIQRTYQYELMTTAEVTPSEAADAIVGAAVISGTGEPIGQVQAIVVDAETGQMGLVLGLFEILGEYVVAPVQEISVAGEYLVWEMPEPSTSLMAPVENEIEV